MIKFIYTRDKLRQNREEKKRKETKRKETIMRERERMMKENDKIIYAHTTRHS